MQQRPPYYPKDISDLVDEMNDLPISGLHEYEERVIDPVSMYEGEVHHTDTQPTRSEAQPRYDDRGYMMIYSCQIWLRKSLDKALKVSSALGM
jgi:hypothetical protein